MPSDNELADEIVALDKNVENVEKSKNVENRKVKTIKEFQANSSHQREIAHGQFVSICAQLNLNGFFFPSGSCSL